MHRGRHVLRQRVDCKRWIDGWNLDEAARTFLVCGLSRLLTYSKSAHCLRTYVNKFCFFWGQEPNRTGADKVEEVDDAVAVLFSHSQKRCFPAKGPDSYSPGLGVGEKEPTWHERTRQCQDSGMRGARDMAIYVSVMGKTPRHLAHGNQGCDMSWREGQAGVTGDMSDR